AGFVDVLAQVVAGNGLGGESNGKAEVLLAAAIVEPAEAAGDCPAAEIAIEREGLILEMMRARVVVLQGPRRPVGVQLQVKAAVDELGPDVGAVERSVPQIALADGPAPGVVGREGCGVVDLVPLALVDVVVDLRIEGQPVKWLEIELGI